MTDDMTKQLDTVPSSENALAREATALESRYRVANPAASYHRRMIVLAVLLGIAFVVSLCVGRYFVSPVDIPGILWYLLIDAIDGIYAAVTSLFAGAEPIEGAEGAAALIALPEVSDQQALISIGQVRLPRILVAMMVGAALSVAGASYQGMFQNPMASQDVLGASSGAAFGAALGIFLALGAAMTSTIAFVFGLGAVLTSYAVSKISRTNPILAMVLAGMVISSLFGSCTSFLKLVADTENTLPAITYWLMGSLASIRENNVLPVFLLICCACIPLYLLRWRINLLATGEEEARSMGLNAPAMRLIVIICATFLTATCVSSCGLVGWVGLVIPHFCRLFLGNDYRRIIPACILLGACFLLVVDDVARLITTSEVPIGILTSFVGAPVFIWLIVKGGGMKNAPKG